MKRTLKLIVSLFLLFLVSFTLKPAYYLHAETKIVTSDYATYQESEQIENNDLGYGIEHLKVNALSTANRCNNQSDTTLSPQVVNVLTVPSRSDVRIVNYTYPNASGWTKQTLTKCVENFENTHPGWIVIAGVNGDFYDINGNDKALPYHTTGSMMSDGELLRVVESKSIGFTNDGSNHSFISTDKLLFSDYHILTIYDELDNEIGNFQIDTLNSDPGENGIAIYYSYRTNVSDASGNQTAVLTQIDVPSINSYIINNPERCLPTDQVLYAKGEISKINEEMTLRFGQFAIVSSNAELVKLLSVGTKVRVQKVVMDEMASCNQIQAVGSTLMKNGEISTDNSDGMRVDRHPRTCIGVKEDGTLMFFVVDGRQTSTGMYGMTQDEQGVMMKYYGCYEGYNIDGGGSTTMGIRKENGEFVIMNSPSDGKERLNANFLLITVPELSLNFSEQSDTSVKVSYGEISKGISIENLYVTIGGITKEMTGRELLFTDLTPETNYQIEYTYDITYNEITNSKLGRTLTFKTGKLAPRVINSSFDIDEEKITYHFSIEDANSLISLITFKSANAIEFIDELNNNIFEYNLSTLKSLEAKLTINYITESEPNRSATIVELIKWYPSNVNQDSYCSGKKEEIENIINEVNQQLSILSKEECIQSILAAKKRIGELANHTPMNEATCINASICSICGQVIQSSLGHEESEWIIDTQASCTTEGKQHKECIRCGETLEEQSIPQKEHSWQEATTKRPKTCSVCGLTEGEKLEEEKKKGCKKTTISIILSSIAILCTSIYIMRKRR